ncbi:MAG: hypothetical protein ACR2JV_07125 [Gaiellales bacterium]
MSADAAVVAAVQAIVDGADEADQILLATIAHLAERYGAGVGLRFVEEGVFTDGPWAGGAGDVRTEVPIHYDGELVGEFITAAELDDDARATFEAVAGVVGDYCLVGWDIGGEDWEP